MYLRTQGWSALAFLSLALGPGGAAAQGAGELPARVIVKLRPSGSAQGRTAQQVLAQERERPSDAVIASLSGRAGAALSWMKALADGTHVFVPANSTAAPSAQIIGRRLQQAPEVAWAQADATLMPHSAPSDPHFPYLWALQSPMPGSYGADFLSAWQLSQGGQDVRIAVVDTGFLPHPDLVGSDGGLVSASSALADEGYDFISDCRIRATCPASTSNASAAVPPARQALDRGDWVSDADRATAFFSKCTRVASSWHGSHTAGTVAALANNDLGIAGGAYGAKLVPVRVLGKCGGYSSDVAEAIRWSAGVHPKIHNPAPARIINLSLGAPGACDTTMQSAIDAATAAGALVIVAAGNESSDASKSMLPSCSNVVAVAASAAAGDLAYYSNYSATHVALSAPGGDMRSTSNGGILSLSNTGSTVHDVAGWAYRFSQGTSMAAPHAAAAAALVLARNGALSPARLKAILTAPSSVTSFPSGSHCATKGVCGAGLLNAQRAVSNGLSPLKPSLDVLEFGGIAVGAVSSRDVQITNQSSAATTVGSVSIAGSTAFSISVDECSGQTLLTGQTCRVQAAVAAAAEGMVNGALQLPTSTGAEGSVASVHLSALIGSRLTSPAPTVSLSSWLVGETRRVAVSFAGRYSQTEVLRAVYISDTTQAAISRDDCSNIELQSGSTCEVELTMTAIQPGPVIVRVVANTNGSDDLPFSAIISGEATQPAASPPNSADSGSTSSAAQSSSGGGGGGGGGSMGLPLLLVFASAAWWRRSQRVARSPTATRGGRDR